MISNVLNMNVSGARPNALACTARAWVGVYHAGLYKNTGTCYIDCCKDSSLVPYLFYGTDSRSLAFLKGLRQGTNAARAIKKLRDGYAPILMNASFVPIPKGTINGSHALGQQKKNTNVRVSSVLL